MKRGGASHVGVFFPKVFEMHKSWKRNKDENEVLKLFVYYVLCVAVLGFLCCVCVYLLYGLYVC